MLQKNRRLQTRAACQMLAACTLALSAAAVFAQNPAPGTAPIQPSSSSDQSQTTAAPGTAPIPSRRVAREINEQKVTTYDERWDFFGGLSFMNGQAGQNLPKRYNMGGGEAQATYWLGPKLGLTGDYRFEAGTTPILPTGAQFGLNRVLVMQSIESGGVSYRGPKNRYAAIQFHALAGASYGIFNSAITGYPKNLSPQPTDAYVGLYDNHMTPWGAAGGSIDFNTTPRLAVRLSPDIIFEHFGTETREFFSIGGGLVYRFGNRR